MNEERITETPLWNDPRGQVMKTPDDVAEILRLSARNARRLAGRRAATGEDRRHGAAGQHEQPAAVDDGVSGDVGRPTLHGVVLQKAIPCPSPPRRTLSGKASNIFALPPSRARIFGAFASPR
jgi:hypothetical protein